MRLLADEGRYVQDCCRHSLAAILYPGPATLVQRPTFAVPACMGQLLSRGHIILGPILWFDPRCEHSSVPTGDL